MAAVRVNMSEAYVLVFLAGVLLDVLWVGYAKGIQQENALKAMSCSMAMGLCSVLAIGATVTTPMLAVPYILGLGVGTLVGMKLL